MKIDKIKIILMKMKKMNTKKIVKYRKLVTKFKTIEKFKQK